MASELKVDKFTGVTTAGSIDVTGEGNSTTTNLQQGLAKVWVNYDSSTSARDSFGISNFVDDGTGDYTANFSVTFANDDFAVSTGGANGSASLTAYCLSTFDYSTTSIEMQTFSVAASSVARADRNVNNFSVHGDLA